MEALRAQMRTVAAPAQRTLVEPLRVKLLKSQTLGDRLCARCEACTWGGDTDTGVRVKCRIFDQVKPAETGRRKVARGHDPKLPAMKAIGVRPLSDYAAGAISRETAMERAITETRQYAKRQETWFRHRFSAWPRATSATDAIADFGQNQISPNRA